MTRTKSDSIRTTIPQEFRDYVLAHPEEYPNPEQFLEALTNKPAKALRVNRHVITRQEITQRLDIKDDPVPWCLDATFIGAEDPFVQTQSYDEGLFYISDPAAMLPGELAQITASSFVVDLCAAPGGKSAHALNYLGAGGTLVANEYCPSGVSDLRFRVLRKNMLRMLSPIPMHSRPRVILEKLNARDLAERYAGQADVVLLDAPSSGEAMMRTSKKARASWSVNGIERMAARQVELLKRALALLKPSGQVVYSTSTFNSKENEAVIDAVRKAFPDLNIQSGEQIARRLPANTPAHVRSSVVSIYPHLARANGQSVAVLSR